MCLATRRDMMTSMEELIKKIEEAAYYYPGTYFADNTAHIYGEGMKAGRAQALRILRGEEPDA